MADGKTYKDTIFTNIGFIRLVNSKDVLLHEYQFYRRLRVVRVNQIMRTLSLQ